MMLARAIENSYLKRDVHQLQSKNRNDMEVYLFDLMGMALEGVAWSICDGTMMQYYREIAENTRKSINLINSIGNIQKMIMEKFRADDLFRDKVPLDKTPQDKTPQDKTPQDQPAGVVGPKS